MIFFDELGDLANPYSSFQPMNIHGFSKEELIDFLKKMIQIRVVEEEIASLVSSKSANCPCHLGIGQEDIPVGIS